MESRVRYTAAVVREAERMGWSWSYWHNAYRISRDSGVDWEVVDPHDPWAHIGYWGDHQIIYLLRLLESEERFRPGELASWLNRREYSYANVPYRIVGLDAILAEP